MRHPVPSDLLSVNEKIKQGLFSLVLLTKRKQYVYVYISLMLLAKLLIDVLYWYSQLVIWHVYWEFKENFTTEIIKWVILSLLNWVQVLKTIGALIGIN